MTLRISVSDSEEEDEITQLNRPIIENKEGVIEEEDIEEQGVPYETFLLLDDDNQY
jgi:hypothetical protein